MYNVLQFHRISCLHTFCYNLTNHDILGWHLERDWCGIQIKTIKKRLFNGVKKNTLFFPHRLSYYPITMKLISQYL